MKIENSRVLCSFIALIMLFACEQSKNNSETTSHGEDVKQRDAAIESKDIKVITVSNSNPGSVNSHLIISPKGIIMIDALRTTSAATMLSNKIDSIGVPLLAIIITHAHPDHFGGLELLHAKYKEVPIYASQETMDDLKTDKSGYIKSTTQFIGKDFGSVVPMPDSILHEKETIGGIDLIMEKTGAGESATSNLIFLPSLNALFSNDMICNSMIPFMLEKRSASMVALLKQYQSTYAKVNSIYPGHGKPGEASELFAKQIEYLEYFRSLVSDKLKDDNAISGKDNAEIVQVMQAKYKGYEAVMPVKPIDMYNFNITAVAEEMKASKK
jgi:glyoxylase-like metal-dependent hydrolase (beta-lactamase superfamily II)